MEKKLRYFMYLFIMVLLCGLNTTKVLASEKITWVNFELDEPKTAEYVDKTPTITTNLGDGGECFDSVSIQWYINDNGTSWRDEFWGYFVPTFSYKYGLTYTVNESCDISEATITLNGEAPTNASDNVLESKVWQNPEVIKIEHIYFDVTTPLVDAYAYPNAKLETDPSDANRNSEQEITWYESDDGITWNKMPTSYFKENKYYKYTTNSYISVSKSVSCFDFTESIIVMNGENATILEGYIAESKVFGPLKKIEINKIEFNTYKPVAGATAPNINVKSDVEGSLKSNSQGITWYESDDGITWTKTISYSLLSAGKYYKGSFSADSNVKAGYTLADDVEVTIDGEIVNLSNGAYETKVYGPLEKTKIDRIKISAKEPKITGDATTLYSTYKGCYYINYNEKESFCVDYHYVIFWYESTNGVDWQKITTDRFVSGKYYQNRVQLYPTNNIDISEITVYNNDIELSKTAENEYEINVYDKLDKYVVTNVNGIVFTPKTDNTPQKKIKFTHDGGDVTNAYTEINVVWYESKDGITWNKITTDKFNANMYYKCQFDLYNSEHEMYDFSKSNVFISNEIVGTDSVNATITNDNKFESPVYGPLERKNVKAYVTVTVPAYSEIPQKTANIIEDIENSLITKTVNIKWYESTDKLTWIEMTTDTFVYGKYYKYKVTTNDVECYDNYKLTEIYLNDEYKLIQENTPVESRIWNFTVSDAFDKIIAAWPETRDSIIISQFYDYNYNENRIYSFYVQIAKTQLRDNCLKYIYEYFKDNDYLISALDNEIIKVEFSNINTYKKTVEFIITNTIDNVSETVITTLNTPTTISDEEWEKVESYDSILTDGYFYYPVKDFIDNEYYKDDNKEKFYEDIIKKIVLPLLDNYDEYEFHYMEYTNEDIGIDDLQQIIYIVKDGLIYNAFKVKYFNADNRIYFPNNTDLYDRTTSNDGYPIAAEFYYSKILDTSKYSYHIEHRKLEFNNYYYFLVLDDGSNYELKLANKFDDIYSNHLLDGMETEYDIPINMDIHSEIGGKYLESLIKDHINDRKKYKYIKIITSGTTSRARVYYYIEGLTPIEGLHELDTLQYEQIDITFNYLESLGSHGNTIIEEDLKNMPSSIEVPALDFIVDNINDFKYENIEEYLKKYIDTSKIQIRLLSAEKSTSEFNHINVTVLFGIDNVYYDYRIIDVTTDDYIVSYESTDTDKIHEEIISYINDNTKDTIYDVSIDYNYGPDSYINISAKEKHDKVGFIFFGNVNERSLKMQIYREYPKINDIIIKYDKDYILTDGDGVQLEIIIDSVQEIYDPIELSYNEYYLDITDDYYVTTDYIGEYTIDVCVKDVCKSITLEAFTKIQRKAYEAYITLPSSIEGKYHYEVIHNYYENILSKYITYVPEGIEITMHNYNDKIYYYITYIENNYTYYTKEVNYEVIYTYPDKVSEILIYDHYYLLPIGLTNYYYHNQTEEYANMGRDYILSIINDPHIKLELQNYTYNNNYNDLNNFITYDFILKYDEYYYYYPAVDLYLEQSLSLDYDVRDILNETKNIILNNVSIDESKFSINYNEELTNSSNFYKPGYDVLGVYDTNVDGNILPITIYREARHLEQIELSKDFNRLIIENGQHKINISITPSNGYYEPIRWESSDENIATVDEYGNVTGLSSGFVNIYAFSDLDNRVYGMIYLEVVHDAEDELLEILEKVPTQISNKYSNEILDQYWEEIARTELGNYLKNTDYELYRVNDETIVVTISKETDSKIYEKDKIIKLQLVTSNELVDEVFPNIKDVYNLTLSESIKLTNRMDWIDLYLEFMNDAMNETTYTILEPNFTESDLVNYVDIITFVGVGNEYYKTKVVRLVKYNEITVPYEIRTEEQLSEYILNILKEDKDFDESKYQLIYNQNLTNDYEFIQENMGIYNVKYLNNTYISVLREERKLTKLEISYNKSTVIMDDGVFKIDLNIEPSNAIYEQILWTSSDENIVKVDEYGNVTPLKNGTVTIQACNNELCDSITLTLRSKASLKLDELSKLLPEKMPEYYDYTDLEWKELYTNYIKHILNNDDVKIEISGTKNVTLTISLEDEFDIYKYSKNYIMKSTLLELDPLRLFKFNYKYTLETTLYNSDLSINSLDLVKQAFQKVLIDNEIDTVTYYTYINNCKISYDKDTCEVVLVYINSFLSPGVINSFKFTFENVKSLTVPYDIRTEEQLKEYVKNTLSESFSNITVDDIELTYNKELTNSYEIAKENIGIYNLIIGEYSLPITIYRVENKVKEIYITSESDRYYIIREQNNKLKLTYTIYPTDAIYENLIWYSSDESIATVDQTGLITALKSGTVSIGLKNDYIDQTVEIRIYTEPEYAMYKVIRDWGSGYSNDRVYKELLKDTRVTDMLIYDRIKDYITDPRMTYRYEFVTEFDNEYDKYSIYDIYLQIENIDGTIYERKAGSVELDYYTPLDEEMEYKFEEEYIVALKETSRFSFEENLPLFLSLKLHNNNIVEKIEILNSEITTNGIYKEAKLDLLIASKRNYYNHYYYKIVTITLKGTHEIEVPYEIRTEEQTIKYMKDYLYELFRGNWTVDKDKINLEYSQTLTENHQFNQENLGVYLVKIDGINTTSLAINRKENKLTNLEITNKYNKIAFDIDNNKMDLSVAITPTDAIYENIHWTSSDETIATVDKFGTVYPKSLGKVTIKAYDDTGLVYTTIEIEVVDNTSIKLIDRVDNLYLYDSGFLYEKTDNYLKLIDTDVMKITDSEYYIKNDNSLYLYYQDSYYDQECRCYIYYHTSKKVMDNVKYATFFGILTTDGKLYSNYGENDGELVAENVKSFTDSLMYLTNDDTLYVVGNNHYGEKFNNNNYIDTPMILFENVLDYGYNYVLLKDGTLYTFSNYAVAPEVVDTGVLEVTKFLGYYYNSEYYSIKYALKKDGEMVQGTIGIINKAFVVTKNIIKNATYIDYWIDRYDNISNSYYYIDNFNNLYSGYEGKIAENVKEAFVTSFDYTDECYLHYITNDNLLYRVKEDNTVYYITNNILSYAYDNLFITTKNDLWAWDEYVDYPLKLSRVENPTNIKAEGIYIYEYTKTKLTVDDVIDILGIILPYNATNNKIVWSVDNPELAKIDEKGVLTALKEGIVTVYAKTEEGNLSTSITIKIHPKVSGIKIYGTYEKEIPNSINNGDEHRFTIYANIEPAEAIDRKIIWSSSDDSLVYIYSYGSCYGYIDGIEAIYDSCASIYVKDGVGEVTIYAKTANGLFEDSITISVVQNIESITFEEEEITLNLGKNNTYQLNPTYEPDTFDTKYLEYSIRNTEAASVTEDGLITAHSKGYATVTVSAFGRVLKYIYVNIIKKLEPVFDYIEGLLDKSKSLISKIKAQTEVNDFKNSIENNEDIKIVSCDNDECTEITNGIIKTGYKVRYVNEYDEIITYDLSVFGDVSKDGKVNAVDLAVLLNHLSGSKVLEGSTLESAYMNTDDKVNAVDLAYMLNHIAGKEGF